MSGETNFHRRRVAISGMLQITNTPLTITIIFVSLTSLSLLVLPLAIEAMLSVLSSRGLMDRSFEDIKILQMTMMIVGRAYVKRMALTIA